MAGSTRAECYLNLNDVQGPPSASARPSLVAAVPDDPGYSLHRHLHQDRHHRPPVGFGSPPNEAESRQRMAHVMLALASNLPSAQK